MKNDGDNAAQTVGQGGWIMEQGDCMISIAEETGHFWEKLWNLPENRELKKVRKDPNVLLPGDRVTVPEIEPGEDQQPDGKRYRYRRKGVPSVLRLRVAIEDEPLADKPYQLDIDGQLFEGRTDRDGRIEQVIPCRACEGVLTVGEDPDKFEFPLRLGHMNPIDTISGIKSRLNNLGYSCGEEDDSQNEQFRTALKKFQEDQEVDMTGEPDQATKDKLKELGV